MKNVNPRKTVLVARVRRAVSATGTLMQCDLADDVRRAERTRRLGVPQSWRTRDVIRRRIAAAATLEAVVDDMLAQGAPADEVRQLAWTIERHIELKLAARDGLTPTDFATANLAESKADAALDPIQVEAQGNRCPSVLRDVARKVSRALAATRVLLHATQAELQRVEAQPGRQWG